MLNVNKVKGRMRELGLTQKDIAKAWNVATPTASQKLNRLRPINLDEAEVLGIILKIPETQFGEYFFNP